MKATIITFVILHLLLGNDSFAKLISETALTSPDDFRTYLKTYDTQFTSSPSIEPDSTMLNETFSFGSRISAIVYEVDGLKIRGFVFKPNASGTYPGLIYNRGGNRDFGSLTFKGSSIGPAQLAEFASWGYVVIASQYRGAGGSEGEDHMGGDDVNDILALPGVLDELDDVDTSRLGLLGWSRGSMMSFQALKKGLKVNAVIVGGLMTNLELSLKHRPVFDKVYTEMDPAYVKDKTAWLRERSAILWVDKLPKIPMLVLNGSSDWRTRSSQAINFVEVLDEKRYPVRFIMYEGADHAISQYRKDVFMQVRSWLDRYVRDQTPAPVIEYTPKS